MTQSAIGLVETEGLVGAIEAADTAAKTAQIQLLGFETSGGGLVTVRFTGDVASVQTALLAATAAAQKIGRVVAHHVIPAPHAELTRLTEPTSQSSGAGAVQGSDAIGPLIESGSSEAMSFEELEELPVAQLRQLVRQSPGTVLKGREVSRANKEALLEELERVRQRLP